jgi:hydrogenase-1 operon protein HyaF
MKAFSIPVVAAANPVAPAVPSAGDAELCYAPLPRMETFIMPIPQAAADPEAGAAAARLIGRLLEPMRAHASDGDGDSWRLDLGGVAPAVQTLINQSLGEGDVSIIVDAATDTPTLRIQETAFTGLWRVRSFAADGSLLSDALEIAAIPAVVRARAASADGRAVRIGNGDQEAATGLINAPAVLFEIAQQLDARNEDSPPYIINLTLLPMQPEDLHAIDAALGSGPVQILSRGFGNCRISASRLAHLWRVQYFNAMETRILDTIEVTSIPEVALATAEDIADSAERLAELIDWLRDE